MTEPLEWVRQDDPPVNQCSALGLGDPFATMSSDVEPAFRRQPAAWLRRRIEHPLRRELAAVPTGMPVRVFAPGNESSDVMGVDLMSDDRAESVILASFLEAGAPPVAAR